MAEFVKGQPVRLSSYGRSANLVLAKHLDRVGRVESTPRSTDGLFTVEVRWPGRKTTDRFFCGFLELVP